MSEIIDRTATNALFTLDKEGTIVAIASGSNRGEWLEKIEQTNAVLKRAVEKKQIVLLYRGEKPAMINSKTGREPQSRDQPHFDRLFVIGSKAKTYYEDRPTCPSLKQFDRPEKVDLIFDTLNKLLRSQKMRVQSKLNYFANLANKDDFIKRISSISNSTERRIVVNYYFAFAHTIDSSTSKLGVNSMLISCSRDFDTAKKFSNDGYILVLWLSIPICKKAIDFTNLDEYMKLLSKYGLPKIDVAIHPTEQEVSIFSAIYPQRILCVFDIKKQRKRYCQKLCLGS